MRSLLRTLARWKEASSGAMERELVKIGEELVRASVANRQVMEVPLVEVPALGLVQEVKAEEEAAEKAVVQALALEKDQGEGEGEGMDTGWTDAEPEVW